MSFDFGVAPTLSMADEGAKNGGPFFRKSDYSLPACTVWHLPILSQLPAWQRRSQRRREPLAIGMF
jgi:hypothetical protein